MEERNLRNDLNVAGLSQTAGGEFHRVSIDGMAKVNGNLDCTSLNVNGTLKMHGALSAESATINGMCTLNGPLNSSRVRVDGLTTINGDLHSPELEVNGKCTVRGRVNGERIDIGGVIDIEGDVQCESLNVQGNIKISGFLNAGTVEIRLHTSSSAKEIGGERIDIRRKEQTGFWKSIGLGGIPSFKTSLIEGDEIVLEDTEADIVRGNKVHIGRGCNVRVVEYSGELEVDPDAKVGSSQRI
ncbi:MAG TPA: hypothetical protein DEF35_17340 [Paenibacillus sp.]|uniref:polymer-forming cytoskeletal protein n=1 Tax=Paenibacillus TaxID=44249 RepID=UPI000BA0792B|nr:MULTISPECIES: polymer-forming cytoskeletal protein [Paenibacillus]OZQ62987.1 hypothetical protein CA599_25180 [Paenibacillus taichungensis]HBU83384.1 hypothetical protein [Paenibacillus sp.]